MIDKLKHPDVIHFLREHESTDVNTLLLKYKQVAGVPMSIIVNQILGMRKAKEKLPFLYNEPAIIYPPALNLEQSSSEITGNLKHHELVKLLNSIPVAKAVDLTGGFGIDSYFLSKLSLDFDYVEPDADLLEVARHNHSTLGITNIKYHNSNAETYLATLNYPLNFAFVDPSRRAAGNKKVFKLSECEPNIAQVQDAVFQHTDILVIKTSPLLDISIALAEINFVSKVIVVSVENDCKELLLVSTKGFQGNPLIKTVNVRKSETEIFEYQPEDEHRAEVAYSQPLVFLYEPNASIMKAGAFKLTGVQYGLKKLHQNTHLYTSEKFVLEFPGRVFRILHSLKADVKLMKELLPEGKANVTTRNYPLTVEEIKKKFGIKDGGNRYVIGYTDIKTKGLLLAERLK